MSALLACASAIAWVGSAQHRAMQAAQDSRAVAFAAARGYVPPANRDGARLVLGRDRAGSIPSDRRQAQLQQDWLRVDTHLVTASTERKVEPVVGMPIGAMSLRRHVSVAQAGGHAVSDMDGQQRILDSKTGWGQAGDSSQALADRLKRSIAGVDGAWGNRKPDIDWVSAWSNLVPSGVLVSGGRP
jgi:hypothetical protein